MSAEPIVALVGRRDEPTDGVADYCEWLGGAVGEFGYRLETVRLEWAARGWRGALADLHERAEAWRGRWVLLQYTALAWSRRGFPWQTPRILSVLRKSGVRCGVVFHDFEPFPGVRMIDRLRQSFQVRVLQRLYLYSDLAVFTGPVEKVSWLPSDHAKAVFIPIGANCPEPTQTGRASSSESRTVAVFCVTGGRHMITEIKDIGHALKRAATAAGPLRLIVMGRGSRDAELALREEFAGTSVDVKTLGLLSPGEISQVLARADVMLFVRSEISSRRGSAIAGVACGLPVVCYAGADTAWPVTEAGILTAPFRDREALSAALERIFLDDALRVSLAARSRHAQERYFSWPAIAAQFAHALQGVGGASAGGAVAETTAAARIP